MSSAQTRTIRVIVPFGAGGGPDTIARVLSEQIAKARGVAMVVENRPGAGAIVGTEAALRAAADGNTLLMTAPSFLINPHIRKVGFDPLTDFEPICHLVSAPPVFAVQPSSAYRSMKDLIEAARAKPGTVTIGSPGPGSTHHLIVEALKQMAKVDMTYVPYPTTPPAVTAVLGGHVASVLSDYGSMAPQLQGGQLRALAVAASSRMAALADVPTLAETGLAGLDMQIWFGVVAPGRIPKDVAKELIAWFRTALDTQAVRERLAALRFVPADRCGAEFAAHLRQEYQLVGRIIREAGIKVK
jgi:tripartite-type tricarboxylate transporter receptor subunit TctC